jgi:hypothetical protein
MRLPTGRDSFERQAHGILEREDGLNQKTNQDILLQGRDLYVYDAAGNRFSLVDLVSTAVHRTSYYVSSSSTTSISNAGTYYKAAGTTTVERNSGAWTHSDNRMTYAGTVPIMAEVIASFSTTCSLGNQTLGARMVKNGESTALGAVASTARRVISSGSDIGMGSLLGLFPMTTGDYIEIWVANETTGSGTVTLDNAHVIVKGTISSEPIMHPASGSFSVTGSDATLLYAHLSADSGTFDITGSSVTLTVA